MYDLIIVGGGPAGISAGIYASRKKIKTLLITDTFGGQSIVSDKIENWIGEKEISGYDLAKKLENHLKSQEGIEILENDLVIEIKKIDNGFEVKTKEGKTFETKYLLIATGSRHRRLNVPGEKEFEGRGVFYCATCDAPLLKNKIACVIGGGNSGLESALDLVPYASLIYILEYTDKLKGDDITQEKIKSYDKIHIITSAEVIEIFGQNFVSGLKYKDRITNKIKELKTDGVFVAIGMEPNSYLVKDLVKLNNRGEIIVDPKTQQTSLFGIWSAGDVTDFPYKQNNIAVGNAISAVLNIYENLKNKSI
jgi:alkyl hydroperoxide reductase subunit F